MKPTFIDLFAGAGLFSAGFMRAGFEPLLAIELSVEAARSYRRNVAACISISSATELPTRIPRADVLIAGPPCQGFSTLGLRDPRDKRSALSLAVLPWVHRAKPKIVVIENVPPFIRSPHWKRLERG